MTTATDTVLYERDNPARAYHIAGFDEHSMTIRRPKVYHDTLVLPGQYQSLPSLPYSYNQIRVTGKVKKEHKKYFSMIIIHEYEYITFQFRDITSVQYPPEASETTGCIFCPFVPIYNIYFIKKMSRRWKPETFDMDKWSFVVRQELPAES